MNWNDIKFADEKAHPDNLTRSADVNSFNNDLFNWYKSIINFRKSHSALSSKNIEFVETENEILAFHRFDEKEKLFVVINNSNIKKETTIALPKEFISKKLKVIFGNSKIDLKNHLLSVSLQKNLALSFQLIKKITFIFLLLWNSANSFQNDFVAKFDSIEISEKEFSERMKKYLDKTGTKDNILLRKQVLQNMINEKLIIRNLQSRNLDNDSISFQNKSIIKNQILINEFVKKFYLIL